MKKLLACAIVFVLMVSFASGISINQKVSVKQSNRESNRFIDNCPPVINGTFPLNGKNDVSVSGIPINVEIYDSDNDSLYVEIWSNLTGIWVEYASWDVMLDWQNRTWSNESAWIVVDYDKDGQWYLLDLVWNMNQDGWGISGNWGFAYNNSVTDDWGMIKSLTTYFWSVNVTDSLTWTNETFYFTTELINIYDVYVDDDFDSSTPGWGYDYFDKIQDGIDVVAEGGTVYVYNGTYYENVVVDKTINLIGENKNKTIVDGSNSGYVVTMSNNFINMSDFTISNCGNGDHDSLILVRSYNKIKNCILKNVSGPAHSITNYGASNVHDVFVENCIFINAARMDMAWSCDYITIINCSFNNSGIIRTEFGSTHIFIINCYSDLGGIEIKNSQYCVIKNCVFYSKNGTGCSIELNNGDNCLIDNNIIVGKPYGIIFADQAGGCNNNIVSNNTIINCSEYGYSDALNHGCSNHNNFFYHNNFINNGINAYDCSSNTWDNSYPSGGNYWDDYYGVDDDGDGIGDTPYSIPGGDNEDNYPLMHMFGPPYASFIYDNETSVFDGSLSGDYDGEIVNWTWIFGDGAGGYGEVVYHKYCEIGTYYVTLIVTDDDGFRDKISKRVDVILANIPPFLDIDGPSQGKPGVIYEYIFTVIDSDGDEFYLWVDWGDGDSTGWLGPFFPDPGLEIKLNNAWNETGTYVIKAKIRDFCGESNWIEFTVTIPRNKVIYNGLLFKLFESYPKLAGFMYPCL
jgi:nitrous oxidase accessory protein NosD